MKRNADSLSNSFIGSYRYPLCQFNFDVYLYFSDEDAEHPKIATALVIRIWA